MLTPRNYYKIISIPNKASTFVVMISKQNQCLWINFCLYCGTCASSTNHLCKCKRGQKFACKFLMKKDSELKMIHFMTNITTIYSFFWYLNIKAIHASIYILQLLSRYLNDNFIWLKIFRNCLIMLYLESHFTYHTSARTDHNIILKSISNNWEHWLTGHLSVSRDLHMTHVIDTRDRLHTSLQ